MMLSDAERAPPDVVDAVEQRRVVARSDDVVVNRKRFGDEVVEEGGGRGLVVGEEPVELGGRGRQRRSDCLLYTSPSPRDRTRSRMPSSA